jgi:hypothetical protein
LVIQCLGGFDLISLFFAPRCPSKRQRKLHPLVQR